MSRPVCFLDLEVYKNYVLCAIRHQNGETELFEKTDLAAEDPRLWDAEKIREILLSHRVVTFNGLGYDMPLLMYALTGASVADLKKASDRIIINNCKPWNFEREFRVKVAPDELDHVDLMEVAPMRGSLKLYGGRMHSRSIEDLPREPGSTIVPADLVDLRRYCINDTSLTEDLYTTLKVQLDLREAMSARYKVNLMSKSDPQIAEAVMKVEIERRTGRKVEKPGEQMGTQFQYQIPSWMGFLGLDILDSVRGAVFEVTDTGGVLMPPALKDRKIEIGKGVYRMGIGGLHSSEERRQVHADSEYTLLDFDVASYYPAILLNQGLFPKHIGPSFLEVYRELVFQRLVAKKAGLKTEAESLKICVNGLFGKLGSKWSVVYAPNLMIQITVTGQLALLMLIESLEDTGIQVVSANTDGVTVRCRRGRVDVVEQRAREWEKTTGFTLERKEYRSLWSADVNNYIALQTNGEIKTKGWPGGGLPLQKNPTAPICAKAVINQLTLVSSIEETIRGCQDIRQFLSLRQVKGGAKWREQKLGKVIRWIYSKDVDEAILYCVNNYLVPKTYGARPLMDLPEEFPEDLDHQWYINTSRAMLADLGVE
ncbi:MAG: hypothetical protein Q7R68_11105 [Nitrospirales bacterium]|nr:hypothetical protein [Nitrospirales bacterium]